MPWRYCSSLLSVFVIALWTSWYVEGATSVQKGMMVIVIIYILCTAVKFWGSATCGNFLHDLWYIASWWCFCYPIRLRHFDFSICDFIEIIKNFLVLPLLTMLKSSYQSKFGFNRSLIWLLSIRLTPVLVGDWFYFVPNSIFTYHQVRIYRRIEKSW